MTTLGSGSEVRLVENCQVPIKIANVIKAMIAVRVVNKPLANPDALF
jgi:hypothetical protein